MSYSSRSGILRTHLNGLVKSLPDQWFQPFHRKFMIIHDSIGVGQHMIGELLDQTAAKCIQRRSSCPTSAPRWKIRSQFYKNLSYSRFATFNKYRDLGHIQDRPDGECLKGIHPPYLYFWQANRMEERCRWYAPQFPDNHWYHWSVQQANDLQPLKKNLDILSSLVILSVCSHPTRSPVFGRKWWFTDYLKNLISWIFQGRAKCRPPCLLR